MWPVTDVGGLAVKLFFFLSGLFVAQSFHRNTDLVAFVTRRFLRIWPALFICLLVTALVLAALTGDYPLLRYLQSGAIFDYVVRNSVFDLTWQINGVLEGNRLQTINGPIHTLPMEAKMYVVLAGIGVLGLMKSRARIIAGSIAALVFVSLPVMDGALGRYLFNASWSKTAGVLFLVGVLAYGLSPRLRPALWQGVPLILLAWATDGLLHEIAFYGVAIWAMLLIGQAEWLGRLWRPREDLSYGIYLYGWPCQQMVLALVSPALNPWVLTVLATALAAVFALLSWRIVEKPAMSFGKGISVRTLWPLPQTNRKVVLTLAVLLAGCIGMRWAALKWDLLPVTPLAATIVDFGPHESRVGERINPQPGGGSAIWLKLEGDPGDDTVVVMDGRRLESASGPGLATAKVKGSILASAGDKKIYLERRFPNRIERSNEVVLVITP